MPLFSPKLDDRTFDELLEQAKRRAVESCPGWTDFSPGDPGVVLLELFAFLTETMIYRLNRLPEKAYIEFLRLMGVRLHPPTAARVTLRFSRASEKDASDDAAIAIPAGTGVSDNGASESDPVEFITTQTVELPSTQEHVDVEAMHCERIDGELIGHGTGAAGRSFVVSRAPIISANEYHQDLFVGVEENLNDIGTAPSRIFEDQTFRIWHEVEGFADLGPDRHAFVVDRCAGRITFAPAVQTFQDGDSTRPEALAEVPADGREIRVWYRCGGGQAGNVAADTLTVLKSPIPGLVVTNPARSTGGRDEESLSNAILRGPQELHSLTRAVTARDYERIATTAGGIARARAFTKAQVWKHAQPGTVQVLLVPEVANTRPDERLTTEALQQNQTTDAAEHILRTLNERRPLGTTVLLNWMRYKTVTVRADLTVFRGENTKEIQRRVCKRLNQIISPLPTERQPNGWPFEQALRVGRLYDEIFREPGVKQVDQIRFVLDSVPSERIHSISADQFQPSTWHIISGHSIFRSTDDGHAWELSGSLPGLADNEELRRIRTHPHRAGFVAVVTRIADEKIRGRVYVSEDCGETWRFEFQMAEIYDVAWILRDAQPAMLVAATNGLYERATGSGTPPQQILVGNLPTDLGFWTVAVTTDVHGRPVNVAVAAEEAKGVWVSYEGGKSKTFLPLGLQNTDIRVLTVQQDGARSLIWAGAVVAGNQPGTGCYRWGGPGEKWEQFQIGWRGGSCYGLAAGGRYLFAATYNGAVLRMDCMKKADAMKWEAADLNCGLARRSEDHPFAPVRDVAADFATGKVMAGCDNGIYASSDEGLNYKYRSQYEFAEGVVLPDSALFCSGDHEIIVVEDGTR